MEDPQYPIAVCLSSLSICLQTLIDDLKSDDVTLRINAVSRLSTIALALGPARARSELVPFLSEILEDDDEVLVALAKEVGPDFVEYIGGPEASQELLPVLEALTAVEETLACESINKLVETCFTPAQVREHLLPLIARLSGAQWFTARTSACALYATAYEKALDEASLAGLRAGYANLGNDETPMVRRAAAKHLGSLAKQYSVQLLGTELLPLYMKLSTDEQDSVRLLTVVCLITIAQTAAASKDTQAAQELVKTQLIQPMIASWSDKSWRVRYVVGLHFNELATVAPQDMLSTELLPAYIGLLKDQEAEVRTAATGQLPGFAALLSKDIVLSKLLPVVKELVNDASQHARAALASNLCGLAPHIGKDATIEHLLPMFLQLLKDEFPDVRLNIISKLEQVNDVIGIELLSQSLLPAIIELAEYKQWRVCQAIIEYIPLLAKQLGVAFFNEQLGNLCMSWLGNSVYSIREAATINLRKLTEIFGVAWARKSIIPKIVEMASSPNYLFRLTTVFAITTMASALDAETVRDQILDTVLGLVEDPIPNVKFNVAKCLQTLATVLHGSPTGKDIIQQRIVPALDMLQADADVDVKYFANKALESIAAL